MKWIGQHIVDLIARFRGGLYIDNVENAGTDTDAFVVLKNNKVSIRTGSEVLSDIGGSSTVGDITGVTAGTGLSGGGTSGAVTLNVDTAQAQITELGTIEAGTWQGTRVASEFLDTDTAHLSIDQTFTGAKTFSNDTTTFTSANADDPAIVIKNTTDDAQTARLQLWKDRGADGQDGDNCGEIEFWSYDNGTPSVQQYAKIYAEIHEAQSGQESGLLGLGVANHDGGTGFGLILQGGSENNEVDVTRLGLGANSVVSVPGNIDLAGDIDVDGTLETDALTIGGVAVLAQATESAVGAVELATISEARLGTDTTRAVTAAGLTDHVDDRVQYVFMTHFGNAANGDMTGDDWLFPKDSAGAELYTYDDLSDTVANEATTFTLPRLSQGKGIIVPYACTLEGVYGSMVSSSNNRGALALWTFTPAWGTGGSSGVTATRRIYATGDLDGGSNYTSRPAKIYALGGTTANVDTPVDLNAGDSILPALVCPVDGETTNIKCSFTIVLKVKLPDL